MKNPQILILLTMFLTWGCSDDDSTDPAQAETSVGTTAGASADGDGTTSVPDPATSGTVVMMNAGDDSGTPTMTGTEMDSNPPEVVGGSDDATSGAGASMSDGTEGGATAGMGGQAASGARDPQAGEIIISEFLYDSLATQDRLGEWIELHNPTSDDLSLETCVLKDAGERGALALTGYVISAGGYLVFAGSIDTTLNLLNNVDGAFSFTLNNTGGDTINLSCGANAEARTVIDEVVYDISDRFPRAVAASLQRSGNQLTGAASEETVWCLGETEYTGEPIHYGTPGQPNTICPGAEAPIGGVATGGAQAGGTSGGGGIEETSTAGNDVAGAEGSGGIDEAAGQDHFPPWVAKAVQEALRQTRATVVAMHRAFAMGVRKLSPVRSSSARSSSTPALP